MEKVLVAIEYDGDISTGEVVDGTPEVGESVTIALHDENGVPIEQLGTVVEVLT